MHQTSTTLNSRNRHSSSGPARKARGALTLIEMLIGMAITLLMMAAVVNLFANISSGVRIRRATMDMSRELRSVRATLFNDLTGATCRPLPWQRPGDDAGYIEIIEGDFSDRLPSNLVTEANIETPNGLDSRTSLVPRDNNGRLVQFKDTNNNGVYDSGVDTFLGNVSALGDYDDILALTVQNQEAPFQGTSYDFTIGQVENIQSNFAEVIWFAVENPANGILGEPGMRTLYRRVLLIAPWVDPIDLTEYEPNNTSPKLAPDDANAFYQRFDISARYDPATQRWIPNTLGDLAKRENRFAHDPTTFPHLMNQSHIRFQPTPVGSLHPYGEPWITFRADGSDPDRTGFDRMLGNVLAFDLLVFDPGAPLFQYHGAVVEPVADKLFSAPAVINPNNLVDFGAYVDLGWDDNEDYDSADPNFVALGAQFPPFQHERRPGWHPSYPNDPNLVVRRPPAVYDTWSFHYEHDGIDQDNDGLVDEGANGLDDDGQNGVDDIFERETSPPYPVPLRGMRVKLRIYEPDTRQIREASVTRSFVP